MAVHRAGLSPPHYRCPYGPIFQKVNVLYEIRILVIGLEPKLTFTLIFIVISMHEFNTPSVPINMKHLVSGTGFYAVLFCELMKRE